MSGRSGSGGGGSAGGGSSGAGPSRGRRLSVGAGPSQSYPGPDDDAGLLNKLLKRRSSGAMQLPQQPLSSAQLRRNRDKLVALLEEGQYSLLNGGGEGGGPSPQPSPVTAPGLAGDDELLPAAVEETPPAYMGRIAIHATAASYELKGLREHLQAGGYTVTEFPEALYSRYVRRSGQVTSGEFFLFAWGTTCFWDLSPQQERKVLATLQQFEEGKLPTAKVESDTFRFALVPYSKPSIQNDVITLPPNLPDAHLLRLAISFALAQSTKLCVLEEQALSIAALTRRLPIALARDGRVHISDRAVAKLMGRVFIQQAALNLMGSVLDTPDFFWEPGVPDSLQTVYDKVYEYLELGDRIEVLNSRLQVLHELLDMLRLQGQAQHSDTLEWIIIILICVDVVILLATLAATLGWLGEGGGLHAVRQTRYGSALAALLGGGGVG